MVTTVSDESCSTVNSMRYWSFTRMEAVSYTHVTLPTKRIV